MAQDTIIPSGDTMAAEATGKRHERDYFRRDFTFFDVETIESVAWNYQESEQGDNFPLWPSHLRHAGIVLWSQSLYHCIAAGSQKHHNNAGICQGSKQGKGACRGAYRQEFQVTNG